VESDTDPQQGQQEHEERAQRLIEYRASNGDARTSFAPLLRGRRGLVAKLVETTASRQQQG